MRSIRPNEFRNEFIKFSYKQIIKNRKMEKLLEQDWGLVNAELSNFGNEAVDDPYKDKKNARKPLPAKTTKAVRLVALA